MRTARRAPSRLTGAARADGRAAPPVLDEARRARARARRRRPRASRRAGVSASGSAATGATFPASAAAIVELDHDRGTARLHRRTRRRTIERRLAPTGSRSTSRGSSALALAPCATPATSAVAVAASQRVGLLELLGLRRARPPRRCAALGAARRRSSTRSSGVGAHGPFAVDLRADGPHALVAGHDRARARASCCRRWSPRSPPTHPPDRLAFLLVDYKGGAAFKDCVALPHTVGVVTDLDEHLAAARAGLARTPSCGAASASSRDAGAKDLLELERRATRRRAAEPPDRDRRVRDAREGGARVRRRRRRRRAARPQPRRAPRARHAAAGRRRQRQHPREHEPAHRAAGDRRRGERRRDRRAATPPGSRATRPGRGVRAHGPRRADRVPDGVRRRPSTAARDGVDGIRAVRRAFGFETRAPVADRRGGRGRAETDLQRARRRRARRRPTARLEPAAVAVAAAARAVAAADAALAPAGERPRARRPCSASLDEPARQRQRPLAVDLEREGSLLVYGASGSGKTTLLRTLAVSLAERPCAGRAAPLRPRLRDARARARSRRCRTAASVVARRGRGARRRGCSRCCGATLERRKLLLRASAACSRSPSTGAVPDVEPLPRIVVLLDGYAGFAAAFERVDLGALVDALPRLVADGRPLGVHFAITADRRGAVPNALAGIVPAKIVLRMADEDEFAALGVPRRSCAARSFRPGAASCRAGRELQVAVPGDDPAARRRRRRSRRAARSSQRARRPARADGRAAARRAVRRGRAAGARPSRSRPLARPRRRRARAGRRRPRGAPLPRRRPVPQRPLDRARRRSPASLRASTPSRELHLLAPRRTPLAAARALGRRRRRAPRRARRRADAARSELEQRPSRRRRS